MALHTTVSDGSHLNKVEKISKQLHKNIWDIGIYIYLNIDNKLSNCFHQTLNHLNFAIFYQVFVLNFQ